MEFYADGLALNNLGGRSLRSECLAIVEYWDADGVVRDSGTCGGNGWQVSVDKNGSWTASSKHLGLSFIVRLEGKGDSFSLIVPKDGIKESGSAKLKSLRLLPGLLGGYEGDGSILVIPFDNGALCRAKAKPQSEFKLPVAYPFSGICANMPLSGIDCGNGHAVSAIVDGGQFDFYYQIRTSWGDAKLYSIDHVFAIRDFSDEKPLDEDISIHFRLLKGGEANYAGIAKVYRKYRKLPTLKQKLEGNPTLQYAAKALSLRCRLAVKQMPTPVLEQTPETQPPMKVYMTFEKIRMIVEECARQGVGPTEFNLVGWNYGGHDGAFPQLFPVEEQVGGEAELRKTVKRSLELGYPMSLHDNFFDSYSLANNFNPEYVNRNHDGSKTLSGQYGGGQSYQLCSKCACEHYADSIFAQEAALGVKGSHYSDVLSVVQVTKCYHPEHLVSRRENSEWWKLILGKIHNVFGSCSSEGARDWSMPELDRAYSVSARANVVAPCIDEHIPLFQLVYHGYLIYNCFRNGINTFPGEDIYLLNFSYGGIPIVYFHQIFNPAWTAADGWDKDFKFGDAKLLVENVAKIKRISDDIAKVAPLQTEFIEGFIRHSATLTETIYSNGASLFANFADSPAALPCGATVPAKDFIVKQGA